MSISEKTKDDQPPRFQINGETYAIGALVVESAQAIAGSLASLMVTAVLFQ
jgi:hypothetical protein